MGESEVQNYPQLQSDVKVSLEYMKPCLKAKFKNSDDNLKQRAFLIDFSVGKSHFTGTPRVERCFRMSVAVAVLPV